MDSLEPIKQKIYEIRGRRVMLDSDLATLYCVETKNLKRAVKRNIERFPDDFMFELTKEEYDALRCQNFTLKNTDDTNTPQRPAPSRRQLSCRMACALRWRRPPSSGSSSMGRPAERSKMLTPVESRSIRPEGKLQ